MTKIKTIPDKIKYTAFKIYGNTLFIDCRKADKRITYGIRYKGTNKKSELFH